MTWERNSIRFLKNGFTFFLIELGLDSIRLILFNLVLIDFNNWVPAPKTPPNEG